MNVDDAAPLEEQYTDLLAAYDEALADGRANKAASDSFVPPELRIRLRQACACLQQLDQYRRASLLSAPKQTRAPSTGEGQLGRFELRRELGCGGFGIVFLAWDSWLHREVALKVPRLERCLTPESRQRFLREARAAAGLDHPGIVPVHEMGEAGGVCYIVSDYCPGINLAQWLGQQTAPIPVREAAALIAALAEAVQHVHERNVWHRDIKPSNILLQTRQKSTADGLPFTPRLTDFGLAKLLEAETQNTPSGAILGTPTYMAPEQASGQLQKVGPHTDVYALGAILYELLTGRPPFHGATSLDVLRQVTEDEPVSPRQLRSDVPRDLETICLKCVQKEPLSRYVSAAELAADLRRFLIGEAIAARPLHLVERVRRWCLRPERVRSAGMFLISFGLVFFVWCAGCLVSIALGLLQPPRPAAAVRYALFHIGFFYVPMMGTGWKVLGHNRPALWVGTLVAFAFFIRMFVFAVIWGDWLGYPQPIDMGGLLENASDRVMGNLVFTAAAVVLCVYCVAALFASYANPRTNLPADRLCETVKIPMKGETGKTDKEG
jgi:tRNA A-37 threonylcarbamoyl transferase component Bud32